MNVPILMMSTHYHLCLGQKRVGRANKQQEDMGGPLEHGSQRQPPSAAALLMHDLLVSRRGELEFRQHAPQFSAISRQALVLEMLQECSSGICDAFHKACPVL